MCLLFIHPRAPNLINLRSAGTGTARIVGPLTKEEKAVYDLWVAQKQELLAKLEKFHERFKAAEKCAMRNEFDLTMARLWEIIENPPEQIGIG